ncbi:hypothetical protein [Pectobacterium polaris]|uniref:hypothetical protein n=1 Tax=Pectobacterium polaris TaxID=2042057 RepID=UPI000F8DF89B|nr:hypothetical protein [Pectobacterium polaris]RUR97689.1 hypothetical protein KHDHEBDM_02021 [Pectobacterium polaris]
MSIDSRFERFMLSLNSVEAIDSIELNQELRKKKKADYMGMGRKIIFEQKCITQEQSQKIENELEKYVNDDNYPFFYGKRDFNLIIKNLPNNEDIKKRAFFQITKLLESYLSQASKQIESTKKIFNLENPVGVLIILNEKIKILSPEIVVTRLQQRMKEKTGNTLRFGKIDYVIFISETHLFNGIPAVIILEGANAYSHPEDTSEYINYIVNAWAQFNGGKAININNPSEFFNKLEEKKDPLPNYITRSDARGIWYRKNRYMKEWSDDKVAKEAARHLDLIYPYIIKGGLKLPKDKLGELMIMFGDFIEESNIRGLDLRELKNHHNFIEK